MNFDECILFAPGGRFEEDKLKSAIFKLKKRFSQISYQDLKPEGYFSGSVTERKSQLSNALKKAEETVNPVWMMAVRGGYGTFDLVEDFKKSIFKNKFVLSGFSDITVLLNQHQKNNLFYPVYGINALASFADEISEISVKYVDKMISDFVNFNYEEDINSEMRAISDGEVRGEIFGGCLSVLLTMIGTDYFPDLRNQILFLEDINEPVYKLDRMLNQLQSIGAGQQ